MTYIAITQGTSDWLLGKTALIDGLAAILIRTDGSLFDELGEAEFVEGPMRIAASSNNEVIAIWNVDYLTGTGEEAWGVIKLDGEMGLSSEPSISREVLERSIYVVNQRLQGLILDGSLIHRSYTNESHTCLAGRGSLARQFSIGYFEKAVDSQDAKHQAVITIGPAYDFAALSHKTASEAKRLPDLVKAANALISANRKRTVANENVLEGIRRLLRPYTRAERFNEYGEVQIDTHSSEIPQREVFRTVGLSLAQWTSVGSPLSDVQRRILFSDAIERHPLRIVGPGGSGKTLLMQLLALSRLKKAKVSNSPIRILYITHNSAMAESVIQRFNVLEGEEEIRDAEHVLDISTLAEYGRNQLNLDYSAVIDPDAYEAKQFQLEQVEEALRESIAEMPDKVSDSRLFSEISLNPEIFPILAKLVMAEISTAIKGHGLESDRKRYVQSERSLSRLHGILTPTERTIIYNAFEKYNRVVFEQYEVLDTDDIALSLLGRLRTPIWELKRRKLGYDFVFVDETQLFNENERRVLPLLTSGTKSYVPVVLALDEAQDIYSQSSAGLATLGIPDITNENLSSVHRSTRSIVRLAFYIIQRSTDLFGPDFPDYTGIAEQMEPDSHPLAAPPSIDVVGKDTQLGRFVVKRIRECRRSNLRQVAVICHADTYWDSLLSDLKEAELPLHVLLQRGEKLPSDQPIVVLTRPLFVGGQEFDAVILVGLEQGLIPPRVIDNDALAAAVEQQSLREMYLAVTRARYRLSIVITAGATPTALLQSAEQAGLVIRK